MKAPSGKTAPYDFFSRNRRAVTAWLLWLFLGIWGAHRLYLGYQTSGLIMLGITAYISLGFILSLAFQLITAPYGVSLGIAILTMLAWHVADAFRLPRLLHGQ
jgi:TM2 domain-containing membrane protein YozV